MEEGRGKGPGKEWVRRMGKGPEKENGKRRLSLWKLYEKGDRKGARATGKEGEIELCGNAYDSCHPPCTHTHSAPLRSHTPSHARLPFLFPPALHRVRVCACVHFCRVYATLWRGGNIATKGCAAPRGRVCFAALRFALSESMTRHAVERRRAGHKEARETADKGQRSGETVGANSGDRGWRRRGRVLG